MSKNRYTIAYRIDDIIALTQILAYANESLRTENGLVADLGTPKSSKTWEEIARSHTEFFRYSECNKEYPFSLVARYTMPKIIDDSQKKVRSPIPNELVKELLNLAVILHDKEVRRNEHWKIWLPPLIAGIPGLIAFFLTIYGSSGANKYLNYKIDSLEKRIIETQINSVNNLSNDSTFFNAKRIRKQ